MWIAGPLIAVAFALLIVLERRRPLRRPVEPPGRRLARNLAVGAVGAAAVQLAEMPVVLPLADLVARRGWGLAPHVPLPGLARIVLALLLLDYTLYVWHVLTHRVPWLWRFHVVHHADLDLDASTAVRFHFGELVVSTVWRAGQVALIGVGPAVLLVWQTALLLSTLFHHANLRLSYALERRLVRVVVTPRMHGIHHSTQRAETDANWSSGLTIWDRLHGTLRLNVPQEAVTIGVPVYRRPADVGLRALLAMPFRRQPPTWEAAGDATPARPPATVARTTLLP